MKMYLAFVVQDLRVTLRYRRAIFLNCILPIGLFLMLAELFGRNADTLRSLCNMSVVIGLMGNGLWGGALRVVSDRDNDVLRHFKTMPISPLPLLVGSIVSGFLFFAPVIAVLLLIARVAYKVPLPLHWGQFALVTTFGIIAFRTIGLVVASTVNSMQEAIIIVQMIYMPMIMVGGILTPAASLPKVFQVFAKSLPAFYIMDACQKLLRGQTLGWGAGHTLATLAISAIAATFLAFKLFKWDKDLPVRRSAKLWAFAVLLPFAVLRVYQTR